MNDMTAVIAPKSDQLNADDLVSGPITITIRDAAVRAGTEQPVSLFYEGDNGKPWKPCKTMARALCDIWKTADSKQFIGRSVTLYRDPKVTWAGLAVGGIRISHVSHIDGPIRIAISQSKSKREVKEILPLPTPTPRPANKAQTPEQWTAEHIAAVDACTTLPALERVIAKGVKALAKLNADEAMHDLRDKVTQAYTDMTNALTHEGKPHGGEGFATDSDAGF